MYEAREQRKGAISRTVEDGRKGEVEKFRGNDSLKVNMTTVYSVRKHESEGPSVRTGDRHVDADKAFLGNCKLKPSHIFTVI